MANKNKSSGDLNYNQDAELSVRALSPEQAQARAQHLLRCLARDAKLASDRAAMGSCPVHEMNVAVEACKAALEAVRAWSQSMPGGC